jgi:hypothetical protein
LAHPGLFASIRQLQHLIIHIISCSTSTKAVQQIDPRTMGTKMESLDEYRFDLRDGLRVAARAGLTQLEEMINDVGYSWLDGYMESVMSSSSSSRSVTEC